MPLALSKRENEILKLMLAGKSERDIANALFVSPTTIHSHFYSIFKKKNIHSRRELMAQRIKELEEKLNGFIRTTNRA